MWVTPSATNTTRQVGSQVASASVAQPLLGRLALQHLQILTFHPSPSCWGRKPTILLGSSSYFGTLRNRSSSLVSLGWVFPSLCALTRQQRCRTTCWSCTNRRM